MIDLSTNPSNFEALKQIGYLRRGLNLMATQRLKPLGLGPKQGMLLLHLARHSKCSLADLSKATVTDPAATSRAIDSLIRKGWVEQREHPSDKRRWELVLTPRGRKMVKRVDTVYCEIGDEVVEALSGPEKKLFLTLLKKLLAGLSEDARAALLL